MIALLFMSFGFWGIFLLLRVQSDMDHVETVTPLKTVWFAVRCFRVSRFACVAVLVVVLIVNIKGPRKEINKTLLTK
jgi:hypothetical protein